MKELARLAAEAMARGANIERVILFGSLTNNTYTAGSDADLLVVLRESKHRFVNRILPLLRFFINAPVPVEVFPSGPESAGRGTGAGLSGVR